MVEGTPDRRGFPIVVSGPSGVGKTTIVQQVLESDPQVTYSVSVTTRPPRRGETSGDHYEFVDDQVFDELVEDGALAEWAEVHGYRYGTRASVISEGLDLGADVIMDLDVQGGMSIKRLFPEALLIFIEPPSREELEERLRGRATDDEEVIAQRLANAIGELEWSSKYDEQVTNNDLDETVETVLEKIAERRARPDGAD
ncbi:MAG: guanylate kinase [Candidatus Eisenbacteria bacterium]|nr:guanylate kinase [Candidatus Eisenbacteria bacterium]